MRRHHTLDDRHTPTGTNLAGTDVQAYWNDSDPPWATTPSAGPGAGARRGATQPLLDSLARYVWNKAGRWLMAAASAVALTIGAGPAEAETPQPLRVLTWNIWDLPGVAENSEPLSDDQRWAHVSRRILGGNYDIVVLNE